MTENQLNQDNFLLSVALKSVKTMRSSQVQVNFTLHNEMHEFLMDLNKLTFEEISVRVHDLFEETRRPKQWVLLYRDNEDDLVTVNTAKEFEEACRVLLEVMENHDNEEQQPSVQFQVVPKLTLQEQLAPVLSAVEDVTDRVKQAAVETKESIRQSSYVERGRTSMASSAVHTRAALLSARRGISQHLARVSTVVVEEITEFCECVRRRTPMDNMVEASPVALMATDVERHHDEEHQSMQLETLLQNARAAPADESESEDEDDHLVESVAEDTSEPTQAPSGEQDDPHASDNDTDGTASEGDREWDVVTIDVDDMDVGPWEAAIRTIRDVVPHTDTLRCIDLLDKHRGNVHAILMELTNF